MSGKLFWFQVFYKFRMLYPIIATTLDAIDDLVWLLFIYPAPSWLTCLLTSIYYVFYAWYALKYRLYIMGTFLVIEVAEWFDSGMWVLTGYGDNDARMTIYKTV